MSRWARSNSPGSKARRLRALNLRSGECVAADVEVADSALARMKGLLGRDGLGRGSALWLKPCNWVHTVGMRFPIDILFLDGDNAVVGIRENIPPNSFPMPLFRAKSAMELPGGAITLSGVSIGDRLDIS